MDIEFGDAATLDTNGTGWFLGFSEWAKSKVAGASDLRYVPREVRSHELCMKWMFSRKGDPRGADKPISTGRTLSIMVSESGRFRVQFSKDQGFPEGETVEYTLEKHGHFVVWGEHLYHRWMVDEECTILTLRWIPEVESK